jgi:hypothetical protein
MIRVLHLIPIAWMQRSGHPTGQCLLEVNGDYSLEQVSGAVRNLQQLSVEVNPVAWQIAAADG